MCGFDGAVFGLTPRSETWTFNAEVVSFDGASFESDAQLRPGATFRAPHRLV